MSVSKKKGNIKTFPTSISRKKIVRKVTLSMLPDDCLREILLYLPVLTRIELREVCKRWRRISDDCWREVRYLAPYEFHLNEGPDYITGDSKRIHIHSTNRAYTIGFVQRCAPYITTLEGSYYYQKLSILSALHSCSNLKNLTIRVGSYSEDSYLSNVLSANRQLESVTIYFHSAKYTCLENLSTDCLQKLHVDVRHSGNQYVRKSFAKIVQQKIQNSSLLKSLELVKIGDDEMFKAISEKDNLIHFHVFCFKRSDCPDLTIDGMSRISKMSNLQTIDLYVCDLITDTFFENLGKFCKNLTSISITPCDQVTDKGILALTCLPNLKKLEITCAPRITDKYLAYFDQIESLKIQQAKINDAGIILLLRNNSNLRALYLCRSYKSIETVKVAIEVVNKRTNNVTLNLDIDYDMDFSELQDQLPKNLLFNKR